MHWGTIVDFGRGKSYTLDGSVIGNLFGGQFIVWVTSALPDRESIRNLKFLGTIERSPSELFLQARKSLARMPVQLGVNHTDRTVYNPVLVNCQRWARKLVSDLVWLKPTTYTQITVDSLNMARRVLTCG